MEKLESPHNQALRITTRAVKSSSIDAMLVTKYNKSIQSLIEDKLNCFLEKFIEIWMEKNPGLSKYQKSLSKHF